MLLHLTCAFEVITFPNERVIALFHHFFLQFRHIVEIDQKAHNTTTSRPPVPCILQILVTFQLSIFILVDLEWVYKSTGRRSDKQWLRFQKPPPPPPFARYVSRNGLTIRGLIGNQVKLKIFQNWQTWSRDVRIINERSW